MASKRTKLELTWIGKDNPPSPPHLAALLRPKARFATVIGSYGWGGKAVDQVAGALGPLRLELLDPVLSKGSPSSEVLVALDGLALGIRKTHLGGVSDAVRRDEVLRCQIHERQRSAFDVESVCWFATGRDLAAKLAEQLRIVPFGTADRVV